MPQRLFTLHEFSRRSEGVRRGPKSALLGLQIDADHRKFEQSQVLSDHCLHLDEQSQVFQLTVNWPGLYCETAGKRSDFFSVEFLYAGLGLRTGLALLALSRNYVRRQ
jgi:hypothetical protein